MVKKTTNPLIMLEDKVMTSVEFVWDYLQMRFDGPWINIFSPMIITHENFTITQENREFCAELRDCVGKMVVHTDFIEKSRILLTFENGYQIRISLNPRDFTTPEGVEFRDDDNHIWYVW